MSRSALLPVAALGLACALTGCGGAGSAAAGPATAPATAPALHVGVAGSHFTGVPSSVAPGTVTMAFENPTAATHMAAIGRLADGHSAGDIAPFLAATQGPQGPPPWLDLVGGVDDLDGGHRAAWTGDLAAGHYVLLSLSPDAQGVPDVAAGMLAPFDVTGAPRSAAPRPKSAATVTRGSGASLTTTAIPVGTTALALVNDDGTAHTVDITAIRPGRTYDDVVQEAQQGTGVPPSLIRLGGATVPAHGSVTAGIEAARAGTTYVVFDIEHVGEGAIAHVTAG
ncbi:MAG TPA: hypothetical protein VGN28_11620 [Blastococcus sp.]|nr:hypothetical protein [Blastococcus sp.]